MSMVTPALVAEFKARIERGEHINSTIHEEEQLVYGWEQMHALRISLAEEQQEVAALRSRMQHLLTTCSSDEEIRLREYAEQFKADAEMWRVGREQGLIPDNLAQKLSFVIGNRPHGSPFGLSCSPAARAALDACDKLSPPGVGSQTNIDVLAQRFLTWPLPDSVCSDPCATRPCGWTRTGTNLLTADEARQMIAHLLETPSQGNATPGTCRRIGVGLCPDCGKEHRPYHSEEK